MKKIPICKHFTDKKHAKLFKEGNIILRPYTYYCDIENKEFEKPTENGTSELVQRDVLLFCAHAPQGCKNSKYGQHCVKFSDSVGLFEKINCNVLQSSAQNPAIINHFCPTIIDSIKRARLTLSDSINCVSHNK